MSRIIDPNNPNKQSSVGSKMQQLEQALVHMAQVVDMINYRNVLAFELIRDVLGISEEDFQKKIEDLIDKSKQEGKAESDTKNDPVPESKL